MACSRLSCALGGKGIQNCSLIAPDGLRRLFESQTSDSQICFPSGAKFPICAYFSVSVPVHSFVYTRSHVHAFARICMFGCVVLTEVC